MQTSGHDAISDKRFIHVFKYQIIIKILALDFDKMLIYFDLHRVQKGEF